MPSELSRWRGGAQPSFAKRRWRGKSGRRTTRDREVKRSRVG